MKKLSKRDIEQIVRHDLGEEYEVVETAHQVDSDVEFLPPDAVVSPSGMNAADTTGSAARTRSDDDEEIVLIEPRQSNQVAWDRGVAPKAVIVSSSERKVIGVQG